MTPTVCGDGWQDIASAPRDGTRFDVWVPSESGGYRVTDLWFGHSGKLYGGDPWPADLPRWPTHWMPLPNPPASTLPDAAPDAGSPHSGASGVGQGDAS